MIRCIGVRIPGERLLGRLVPYVQPFVTEEYVQAGNYHEDSKTRTSCKALSYTS